MGFRLQISIIIVKNKPNATFTQNINKTSCKGINIQKFLFTNF